MTKKYNFEYPIAENFLCVCALLELIIKGRFSINLTQQEIAEFFGINVPTDYVGNIKNVTYQDEENFYGTVLGSEGLNSFFKYFSIKLREEFVSASRFEEWELDNFLRETLQTDCDIITGFSYGYLFDDATKSFFGHAALIESIGKNVVQIYDPGPLFAGHKFVDFDKLYRSIRVKKDGIWIIRPTM